MKTETKTKRRLKTLQEQLLSKTKNKLRPTQPRPSEAQDNCEHTEPS